MNTMSVVVAAPTTSTSSCKDEKSAQSLKVRACTRTLSARLERVAYSPARLRASSGLPHNDLSPLDSSATDDGPARWSCVSLLTSFHIVFSTSELGPAITSTNAPRRSRARRRQSTPLSHRRRAPEGARPMVAPAVDRRDQLELLSLAADRVRRRRLAHGHMCDERVASCTTDITSCSSALISPFMLLSSRWTTGRHRTRRDA